MTQTNATLEEGRFPDEGDAGQWTAAQGATKNAPWLLVVGLMLALGALALS